MLRYIQITCDRTRTFQINKELYTGNVETLAQESNKHQPSCPPTMDPPSTYMENTTPNSDGHSPAYKMYQRNPRTTLPSGSTQPPCPVSPRRKVKQSYDQHARNLPALLSGTTVRALQFAHYSSCMYGPIKTPIGQKRVEW